MIERILRVQCLFAASIIFLVLVSPGLAQIESTTSAFQWGFTDTQSTSLVSCVPLSITIIPLNGTGSSGVPPYYMQAFAAGGTPTSTMVGTDRKKLSWVPTHPPGTNLLLSMVDSAGNAGGVDITLYTVIPGQNTNCVVNDDSEDFMISANVTDKLTTCQPWGLRIKGGVPPYYITLAALNSSGTTNTTLPRDDIYTYINRADPGGQLSASVSDATGRWAKGTPLVRTEGSTDTTCPGVESSSSSSNSTSGGNPPSNPGPEQNKSTSSKTTAIIVGVCATVGVLVLALGFVWLYKRRRKLQRETVEHDFLPRQFVETSETSLMPLTTVGHSGSTYYSAVPLSDDQITNQPEPNLRLNSSTVSQGAKGTTTLAYVNEEVVIHHRDGGAVREFPPPYADHSVAGPSS